jgi:hypothetical protein
MFVGLSCLVRYSATLSINSSVLSHFSLGGLFINKILLISVENANSQILSHKPIFDNSDNRLLQSISEIN